MVVPEDHLLQVESGDNPLNCISAQNSQILLNFVYVLQS